MFSLATNDLKIGIKLIYDKNPHVVLEKEFVNPGKGQAFYRIKLRNLINQKLIDRTFKSGETFKSASIEEKEVNYLYNDGEIYYFIDPINFEQIELKSSLIGNNKEWLSTKQITCIVTLWEERPIFFEPPSVVELNVLETTPNTKGDTASGGSKISVLETGAKIKTPLFIEVGDLIKIDTKTRSYISRA